jgi:hypothetical protein
LQAKGKIMSKNTFKPYSHESAEIFDTNHGDILRHRFLSRFDNTTEMITEEHIITVHAKTVLNVAARVAEFLEVAVTGDAHNEYVIWRDDVLVTVELEGRYDYDSEVSKWNKAARIKINVTANSTTISHIFQEIETEFKTEKQGRVRWWYESDRGTSKTWVHLPTPATKLRPEFYPWLPQPPLEFLKGYLDSDQSVLLLAGPPGTGKTTLLRHFIVEFGLTADVVFDEKLMNKDWIFQDFMFSDSTALIIEDADTIIGSRDMHNPMMARFLNVSEGIIKLPNKKLVFTTNLDDFEKVDEALIRPGRCFARVKARPLSSREAIIACEAEGLTMSDQLASGASAGYSLAELFSGKQYLKPRKVGF